MIRPLQKPRNFTLVVTSGLMAATLAGCSPGNKTTSDGGTTGSTETPPPTASTNGADAGGGKTITLAAYSTPREAYEEDIIPAFKKYWKAKTGHDLSFSTTYEASGTQARNIVNGLEADVAALSLEADVNKIQKAGLITGDWKTGPYHGMVTDSVAGLLTRKGNPKGIRDWQDLTKPGVQVLTPNPDTSGGAKWNVLAAYGSAYLPGKNAKAAQDLLTGVRKNVFVMDKSGRESLNTFLHGAGDVAITYENEALRAVETTPNFDLVIPPATLLIENPAAVVDKNAEKHGVKDAATAFVAYLTSDEAQKAFARHHYRPVVPAVAKAFAAQFPKPARLFTIADLGGWKTVETSVFGPNGAWKQAAL